MKKYWRNLLKDEWFGAQVKIESPDHGEDHVFYFVPADNQTHELVWHKPILGETEVWLDGRPVKVNLPIYRPRRESEQDRVGDVG